MTPPPSEKGSDRTLPLLVSGKKDLPPRRVPSGSSQPPVEHNMDGDTALNYPQNTPWIHTEPPHKIKPTLSYYYPTKSDRYFGFWEGMSGEVLKRLILFHFCAGISQQPLQYRMQWDINHHIYLMRGNFSQHIVGEPGRTSIQGTPELGTRRLEVQILRGAHMKRGNRISLTPMITLHVYFLINGEWLLLCFCSQAMETCFHLCLVNPFLFKRTFILNSFQFTLIRDEPVESCALRKTGQRASLTSES